MLPIMSPHPVIENPETLRAAAALAAVGAWDAAPTELVCAGHHSVRLFTTYTRGAAGGAVDIQVQVSPYSATVAGVQNWFPQTLYQPGVLFIGVDSRSNIQAEFVTYTSTAAGAENVISQVLDLVGVERIRVRCRESGVVGTPGTCHIVGTFDVVSIGGES